MPMTIFENPSADEIAQIIRGSVHKAARRLVDPRNGNVYVWDATEGTHRAGPPSSAFPMTGRRAAATS